jgi:hypothetical protein
MACHDGDQRAVNDYGEEDGLAVECRLHGALRERKNRHSEPKRWVLLATLGKALVG